MQVFVAIGPNIMTAAGFLLSVILLIYNSFSFPNVKYIYYEALSTAPITFWGKFISQSNIFDQLFMYISKFSIIQLSDWIYEPTS